MRILVCFPAMLLCSSIAADEQDLNKCMEIEDSLHRLSCFEELAGQQIKQPEVRDAAIEPSSPVEAVIAKTASQVVESKPAESDKQASTLSIDLVDADKQKGGFPKMFGKKAKPDQAEQEIVAYIESVRKSPLGRRIMTLSNGQVWSENEAGKIRIDAKQQVTITKKRWRYAMRLGNDRVIAVKRIDD
ncbi:MAG: hypothetical protein QGD92_11360 [Gammaproteobacteria bacterium]|nr:hypothetical protein [Gammaproteobacteria bacterium]